MPTNHKLNASQAFAGSTSDAACPKIQLPHHGVPDAGLNEGAPFSSEINPFEAEFSDWIAAQNSWVEKNGIHGADLLPW